LTWTVYISNLRIDLADQNVELLSRGAMVTKNADGSHDEVERIPGSMFASPENEKGGDRVDHHGFKLIPQPSHFKDDPLVRVLQYIDIVHVSLI
jgi:hypothetical protein